MVMKAPLTQLVDAAVDGSARARQTRAAARLMTLLESEPQRLPDVFAHLPLEAWPRPRLVLGITGAPGSGKSSLVDALIAEYRRRDPEMRIGDRKSTRLNSSHVASSYAAFCFNRKTSSPSLH